jgi:hypothetical protein
MQQGKIAALTGSPQQLWCLLCAGSSAIIVGGIIRLQAATSAITLFCACRTFSRWA